MNKPYTETPAGKVIKGKNTMKLVLAIVKGEGQYIYVHLGYC